MTDVARWLDERRSPAPAEVRTAIDRALTDAGAGGPSISDALAGAATRALARVARGPSTRAAATSLLAADALLTYACEAAAEAGPDELERLTTRLDFDHFARLLELPE